MQDKASGAKLIKAYLRWSDLSEANLSGAKLSGAILIKIIYNDQTKWPEDFTPPPDSTYKE